MFQNFLELGVKSTECFTIVSGGWEKPSGNTCENTFGNNSGRIWQLIVLFIYDFS